MVDKNVFEKPKNDSLINRSQMRIDSAKSIILHEAKALEIMAGNLNEKTFQKAFIDTLHTIDKVIDRGGKVVVSGMGKSGHIGKKIATTMASMGTLSIFIHPSEAAHGDLGMITKKDMVIAISNSGETVELFPMMEYCNKFKIPLVALTRNGTSTLDKKADIKLTLPNVPEVCPIGKAPTTSMTMVNVLGDVLAVVMAERNGLTNDIYKHWHPGGKLGNSLLTIKQVMDTKNTIILVKDSAKVEDIIKQIQKEKSEANIAVIDSKKSLVGTINLKDILVNIGATRTAKDIMTATQFVNEKDSILNTLNIFEKNGVDFCFICKNSKPIGVIKANDVFKAKN